MTFIRRAAFALLLASAGCSEDDPSPARPDAAPPPPPTAALAPDAAPAAEPEIKIVFGEASVVAEDAGAAPAVPVAAAAPPKKAVAAPAPRKPLARPPSGRETSALAAIRSHHAEVEACYAPVALRDPSVAGRIVLSWTLGRDGMPTAVSVTQNTVRDPAVAACIRERARKWRFPPPAGGIGVVTYPFDLRVQ